MPRLTFLGTGEYLASERYWNGFVVDRHVLVETSPTVLPHLRRCGLDVADLDVILLSHFHADHTFGWPFLLLELIRQRGRDPLFVVGPPGVEGHLRDMMELGSVPELWEAARERLDIRWVEADGEWQKAGSLRYRAVEVDHVSQLRCFGYVLDLGAAQGGGAGEVGSEGDVGSSGALGGPTPGVAPGGRAPGTGRPTGRAPGTGRPEGGTQGTGRPAGGAPGTGRSAGGAQGTPEEASTPFAGWRTVTLGYSGDVRPCPGLDELAATCDTLVLECNGPHPAPPTHMDIPDVADLRGRFPDVRLILTHLGPGLDASHIDNCVLAEDFQTIDV